MNTKLRYLLIFYFTILVSLNCFAQRTIIYDEDVDAKRSLDIHEGIVSEHKQTIIYRRKGKRVAKIKLSEPVIVALADQPEKWGYFQFPYIGIADDGKIQVRWAMNSDSHKSYGKSSNRTGNIRVSKDKGKSWYLPDTIYTTYNFRYGVRRSNRDILTVYTPISKDITQYKAFPKEVKSIKGYKFFYEKELPNELRGAYFSYSTINGKTASIHANIKDPGSLRYAIDDLMPVVWWGNIREMADNSVIAGVYPTYYLDNDGDLQAPSVSFYRSVDGAHNWELQGVIPFPKEDLLINNAGELLEKGLTEPTFIVLKDSTFLCVMRSGNTAPMYQSFSTDYGVTWSKAEAFAPNGVRPVLLKLDNGIIVLSSGRPGAQLRFCIEGNGVNWTESIDMMHFMDVQHKADVFCSCGYTDIVSAGKNSFYVVYSDFHEKNNKGEERKAIKFRKVTIKR